MLWALAGALPRAAGRVRYGEVEITSRDVASRSGICVVPQGNGLALGLTAHGNVLVPMLAAGVAPPEAAARASPALGLVGLEDSGGHLIDELSGGQQQRLALAGPSPAGPR